MFDEETLEKVTMEMLQSLEYESINGYELQREDFSKVLLEEDIVQAIERINKGIKNEQITEVLRLLRNLDNNNTILNNKQFTKYLLEGIPVPVQENGETKYKTVKLIDFNNISNNTFKAINQYTIIEHSEKRPDTRKANRSEAKRKSYVITLFPIRHKKASSLKKEALCFLIVFGNIRNLFSFWFGGVNVTIADRNNSNNGLVFRNLQDLANLLCISDSHDQRA